MPKGLVVLVRGIEGAEPLAGAWGEPPDTKHTYISFFILGQKKSQSHPMCSRLGWEGTQASPIVRSEQIWSAKRLVLTSTSPITKQGEAMSKLIYDAVSAHRGRRRSGIVPMEDNGHR